MAPGDPGLLDREKLIPVGDPTKMLAWLLSEAEVVKQDALPKDDPAAGVLYAYEREWLAGFLLSKHAPATAMTIERLDGYFSALAIYPDVLTRDDYWPPLWNHDDEIDARPNFDNDEQADYVGDLVVRYMEAVKLRIAAGYPHPGLYVAGDGNLEERNWAAGFLRGVAVCAGGWGERANADEDCALFLSAIYTFATGQLEDGEESIPVRERSAFFKIMPTLLLNLHRTWRGLPPVRGANTEAVRYDPESVRRFGRKVGRNEPCPCGSGKKYKRCCGAVN
jgi:uncharacterized protein